MQTRIFKLAATKLLLKLLINEEERKHKAEKGKRHMAGSLIC